VIVLPLLGAFGELIKFGLVENNFRCFFCDFVLRCAVLEIWVRLKMKLFDFSLTLSKDFTRHDAQAFIGGHRACCMLINQYN
jgi:hypothetical protein